MKLFTYRGVRIRKYHRKNKWISFFILLLPFLIGDGFYFYLNYDQIMFEPIKYLIIGVCLLVFSIGFVFVFNKYLYDHFLFFARLDNQLVLSDFLVENGFYKSKKVNQREKISLPKVYLKRDRFSLQCSFILRGNKFQDRFIRLEKQLEVMFDGDFMNKTFTKGFVSYEIAIDQFSGRLSVYDVQITKKGLQLMKDVYWDFDEQPHLLVSGGTGGGKTIVLMILILALAKIGYVDIIDPKQSDFVGLKDIPVFKGRVFWNKDEMLACLREAEADMDKRYAYMTSHEEYEAGKRYSAYGLKPRFVIIDELAAFVASIERDMYSSGEFLDYLTQLVLKGRQAGVFMIVAMQRPDGEYLKTSLRDNFMKRLSVGHLEDSGYQMMYGDANTNKEFKKIDEIDGVKVYGRGYIANGGEIAREFYAPFVPFDEGFSFFEEYKKLSPLDDLLEEVEVKKNKSDSVVRTKDDVIAGLSVDFDDGEDTLLSLKEVAEKLDKTFEQVKYLVQKIEQKDYLTFERNEGNLMFTESDLTVLASLFKFKDSSDQKYDSILKTYFEGD